MKTSPTSLKIRAIVTGFKNGQIQPRPEFQRRLVWTPKDKIKFIETILKGYPFPEIYVANGPVDVETGEGSILLVDGQQRLTSIFEYFHGHNDFFGSNIPSYKDLDRENKEAFLNYDVAVRDLGSVTSTEIVEVFKRINFTKYSLNEIEINNAIYTGEFMQVAQGIAEHEFFDKYRVFRNSDIKRMGDVRFILNVMITIMSGYFNRDDLLEKFLSDYNEVFEEKDDIVRRIIDVMKIIDEIGFSRKSRIWKRSDFFTAFVELDNILQKKLMPAPSDVLERLEVFYDEVDSDWDFTGPLGIANIYAKAAQQASNDRLNRVRRGIIINKIILGEDPEMGLIESGLM
ncbi:DUF262 domain-containing protein [Comamonas kerstersii]|uniref:DUF262 domain-containing protein n=1 Tax=Comamonas kerstersii TaxID=225992 RepID=UPI003EDFDB90